MMRINSKFVILFSPHLRLNLVIVHVVSIGLLLLIHPGLRSRRLLLPDWTGHCHVGVRLLLLGTLAMSVLSPGWDYLIIFKNEKSLQSDIDLFSDKRSMIT